MTRSALDKYLKVYAEQEAQNTRLIEHIDKTYDATLIIPAFDETSDFFTRLESVPSIEPILVLIIINQPEDSPPNINNQHLFDIIVRDSEEIYSEHNSSFRRGKNFDFIVIDRFTADRQIPKKQGVGLARKIAADIACACFQFKKIRTPWIFSTDADASLPDNYFSSVLNSNQKILNDAAAIVFNFHHQEENSAVSFATQLHEKSIKYYQAGLFWAGSPYAFYTLGSTLAFNAKAYAQIRGFPKRAGGEDFYLLNKAAKVGKVEYLPETIILLNARISQRVPFGTGPAVEKITIKIENGNNYCYYNPKIFEHLQEWIHWTTKVLPEVLFSDKNDKSNWQMSAQSCLSRPNIAFIESIQFSDFLHHCVNQCSDKNAFVTHFHIWFDAFKTLKYIHFLQESFFPDIALEQCLDVQNHWS